MAKRLQSLGERMFMYRWWVVGAWVLILAILAFVMVQVEPKTTSQISIPGTQAQVALDRFEELFPDTGAASSRVVIATTDGQPISVYQEDIEVLSTKIAGVDEVSAVVSPFELPSAVSENGEIGFITVQLKPEGEMVGAETVESVQAIIDESNTANLTIAAGGDLVDRMPGEILGIGEVVGVVIALFVLLITLGSLVAAGMPIITALVAVGVSMAGLFSFSQIVDLNSTAPVLAVMLGLAVGIDYSLFIVNRYRTFVKEGYSLKDAAGRAIATAGNAVLFAASTVVVALVSLAVVQIPFMTVMGVAAAATVAIAALVAVTLIPALLGIAGLRVFGRKARREIEAAQAKAKKTGTFTHTKLSKQTFWYHWGSFLVRFKKTILVTALIVVGVLAIPVTQLQLGLPTDEVAAEGTSARTAYDTLAEGFGPGYNGPLLVVTEGLPATTDSDAEAVREQIMMQYQAQLQAAGPAAATQAAQSPEAQAAAAAQLENQVAQFAPYYQLQLVAQNIAELDGVAEAQAILTTDNGTKGVIQVTPTTGPSSQETQDLVTLLRNSETQAEVANGNDVTLAVTGTTALQSDINQKLAEALPVYLAVVVGLSLLILMLAFRSILIPVKATLGFLLSVFAMFGALVAVFQWGWLGIADAPGPIVSFIPIIAIGILFGLAMDYEFFLVSGMQEAYHKTKNAKRAVVDGFAIGSRVVVAAGVIMISVFAGFITNHDSTIQSMGFALAVGILVDAFIVRMTIVPIVMHYLGNSAWWLPKWLEKRLPKISIEGN